MGLQSCSARGPEQEGVGAWVTGVESVAGGGHIDVVSRADTLEPIAVR